MSAQWSSGSVSSFEQPPLGVTKGICIRIVDLGTQDSEYKGEKISRRQNLMTWELPDELRDDGQPFLISKFYTSSLSDKSILYKDLTSWFGKPPVTPFDPKTLIGKGCQLVITERNDKHVVNTVASLGKGDKVGSPVNETIFFSLDEFDADVFDGLSEGVKRMIQRSPEYAAIMSDGFGTDGEAEEDEQTIPF